ncbi:MAG: phosphate ABC transporter substrate-binding protein [Burkholderiales bacterium]|nr:phosphate ABC transporter substrate-binding protein [Burkholderiales bacterium]
MRTDKRLISVLLAACLSPVWADTVVIVNPKQTTKLTPADIRNIYLGNKKSFPDGTTAIPVTLKDGKSRDQFMAEVLGKTEGQYKALWSRLMFTGTGQPPREVESEDEIKKVVAVNPNIIGFIDSSKLDASVRDATK